MKKYEQIEHYIHEFTNKERIKHGLNIVERNKKLGMVARKHCRNMARHGYVGHIDKVDKCPTERANYPISDDSYKYIYIMENCYGGQGTDTKRTAKNIARSIVIGWMKSPGHRQNILNETHSSLGVGVYLNKTKLYAAQEFYSSHIVTLEESYSLYKHGYYDPY